MNMKPAKCCFSLMAAVSKHPNRVLTNHLSLALFFYILNKTNELRCCPVPCKSQHPRTPPQEHVLVPCCPLASQGPRPRTGTPATSCMLCFWATESKQTALQHNHRDGRRAGNSWRQSGQHCWSFWSYHTRRECMCASETNVKAWQQLLNKLSQRKTSCVH